MYSSVLLLAALFFLGCDNKDNSTPKNAVAPNTAAVQIDGVAFPVDVNSSEVIIDAQTGELAVILNTSQSNGPRVVMVLSEFHKKAEKFDLPSQSTSTIDLIELSTGGSYYASRNCNPVRREIEIVAYDEARRMVSGRFNGKMCRGINSPVSKTAVGGQFNLPFRVQ